MKHRTRTSTRHATKEKSKRLLSFRRKVCIVCSYFLIVFVTVGHHATRSRETDKAGALSKTENSGGLAAVTFQKKIFNENDIPSSFLRNLSTRPPGQINDERRRTSVKTFLIFAQQRSGSGYLVDLLNSHPNICCGTEKLLKHNFTTFPYDNYFNTIEYELAKLTNETSSKNSSHAEDITCLSSSSSSMPLSVGFKITYDQGILKFGSKFMRELAQRDYKVVHLVRRNKLLQYVSDNSNKKDMRIKINGVNHVAHAKSEEEAARLRNITVDGGRKKVLEFMRQKTKEVRTVTQLLSVFFDRRNYHEMDYEELNGNATRELELLQTFLGERIEALSSNHIKIHKTKRARYYFPESRQEEVRKALERSEFAWVLDGW